MKEETIVNKRKQYQRLISKIIKSKSNPIERLGYGSVGIRISDSHSLRTYVGINRFNHAVCTLEIKPRKAIHANNLR